MDSGRTVVERLKASLEAASAHNPNDAEKPVAVLWTDRDSQWRPILARLRALMPQLLTLGVYEPKGRTGPSIWLRCVVDGVLELPRLGSDTIPVIYLPDVSRQALGSAETCPSDLKPLVELQYRGTCWTQKNGRDWTVEAFMVSNDGGLGLDVAQDAATRQSMLSALPELATTSIRLLEGRRLEANDFDALFSDDPVRDLLLWLSDPESTLAGWEPGRRSAFASRCKSDFEFDPDKDGALVAADRLGRREGSWGSVWSRFAESPALYPGLPELLHKAMPSDLFVEQPSSWPQNNEKGEAALRWALLALEGKAPSAARAEVLALEKSHGPRREWVWAKLDLAPLASALMHLVEVAERTSRELGGVSPAEMAAHHAAGDWTIDAAALSSFAEVSSSADTNAVSRALNAIYRPWLDAAARHLQALADQVPLPRHGEQDADDVRVDSGAVIFFADGLRLDVSQRLVEHLKSKGRAVEMSTRWAAHPTVTATAKPAVSPISEHFMGASLGAEFQLVTADAGRPLSTDRFRKILDASGYQYLSADDTGDPSGRAWTEHGELDKLGHTLKGKLAARIDDQIALLLERIESLLDAGWREVRVVTDHGWLWLVCQYDVVCFDEISGVSFDQKDGVNILKGYMESGEFSRGKESIRAEGGVVMVGNLDVEVEHQQRVGHLLSPLSADIRDDTAFMDRLHAYVPGWDFPKLNPNEHFTDHFGLVSDFLSECWSRLRTGSRVPALQGRVNYGGALSGRDITAVNKTVSGLLKLLYPDPAMEVPDDELEVLVRIALEARRRVKEQQKRVFKSEFRNTRFSYAMGEDGIEKFVSTPELHSDEAIDPDPLPPGQVWGIGPGGPETGPSLYRIEVTTGKGSGVRNLNAPVPPAFRESVRYAEQNLYTRAKELVGDRDPRSHEFSVQLRAMDNDRTGSDLGLPALMALCSGLLETSIKGGLILVGALSLADR